MAAAKSLCPTPFSARLLYECTARHPVMPLCMGPRFRTLSRSLNGLHLLLVPLAIFKMQVYYRLQPSCRKNVHKPEDRSTVGCKILCHLQYTRTQPRNGQTSQPPACSVPDLLLPPPGPCGGDTAVPTVICSLHAEYALTLVCGFDFDRL